MAKIKNKAPEEVTPAPVEVASVPKKKKTMVIAPKCTCTNPYTKDVFLQGILRDTPKDCKHSWYKSQLEAGYLKEVQV